MSTELTTRLQELTINPLLVMSIEAKTFVDPFARMCQAAHLLGWVCEHVNEHPSASDAELHFQQAFHISRALQALSQLLIAESTSEGAEPYKLFAARGLVLAALNTLYDVHSCIEPDDVEAVGGNHGMRLDLQQHAIDGFKETIRQVSDFAEEIEHHVEIEGVDKLPLTVLFSLHSAAGTYAWFCRENGQEQNWTALQRLKRLLEAADKKWKVSGKQNRDLGQVKRNQISGTGHPYVHGTAFVSESDD